MSKKNRSSKKTKPIGRIIVIFALIIGFVILFERIKNPSKIGENEGLRVQAISSSISSEWSEKQIIHDLSQDFQWKLRDAIERHKLKSIDDMRIKYRNSKEHKEREYTNFCNSIQSISDRLSDESKEFADKAANQIYQATGLLLPIINLFPEGYSSYQENNTKVLKDSLASSYSDLALVDTMDGHEFEYWCAELLKANGFKKVHVTQSSGDQGVDILAEKGGIRYAIQCKCYTGTLGNKPIQEVHAGKAIYDCHVGVVMTNSYFTSSANEAAKKTNTLLWNRDKLLELIRNRS